MAYDEYEHSVFDDVEADHDEGQVDDFDEEDGFDSNEANWARKEALSQGKVLAKGASSVRMMTLLHRSMGTRSRCCQEARCVQHPGRGGVRGAEVTRRCGAPASLP